MEALVFAGGDPPDPRWPATLPVDAWIVAADSGLEHVHALGRHADLVVGDMDSVSPSALERAVAAGTVVERHPADKDATDLELALDAAKRAGATRVTVIGAGGGRLDHFLANALLVAAPAWAGFELHALIGDAHIAVVRDTITLGGRPGSIVSLLPVGGAAGGVRTTGLRWPLAGRRPRARIHPWREQRDDRRRRRPSRSTDGVLLAIQPDADPDLIHLDSGGT